MPNGNGNEGGGTQNGNGNGNGTQNNSNSNKELLDGMRELMTTLMSGKDHSAREEILVRDNFKLRRRNAELRDAAASSTGKVPEGSVVVKKEDADELAAFRALKLKPDDIKASVEKLAKLEGENAARANESVHEEAAEALGYPNVAALSKALKREGLHVEMKSVRIDDPDNPGKKISAMMPHVRKASDEKAALEPLADYIDRELSELVPAFVAEPETTDDDDDESSNNSSTRVASVPMRRVANPAAKAAGVQIPVARNAQKPNGPAREAKQQDEALLAKKKSGAYSL